MSWSTPTGAADGGVTPADVTTAVNAGIATHVADAADPHAAADYSTNTEAQGYATTAETNAKAVDSPAPVVVQVPAAPADTLTYQVKWPRNSTEVASIYATRLGAAAGGKLYVKKGIIGDGNTMLNAAFVNVTALPLSTEASALGLTGTVADLRGGKDNWFLISVENSDADLVIVVTFKNQ